MGGQQGGGQNTANSFGNFGGFGFGGQGGGGAENLLNDPTAQMGVHFGRQMAQAGGEYVEKNVSFSQGRLSDLLKLNSTLSSPWQLTRYLPLPVLKHYFNVSNSYVLHKLRLVLFPWRHKPWSRAHRHGNGPSAGGVTPGGASPYPGMAGESNGTSKMQEGFAPPREDVNSPDLYIPGKSVHFYMMSRITH
jgi:hypothetical protein